MKLDFPKLIGKWKSRSHNDRNRDTEEARMRVPKMVKNGLNSVLPISPVFGKDKTPKKSRADTKPKAFLKS
jgi:hypothetical protein